MSILDSVLSRFGYAKASAQKYPDFALGTAAQSRWSMPEASSVDKQARLYKQLTWIATAIDFVAQASALLAFNVKELKGEEETDVPNHEFEMLLRRPNPKQSRFEFIRDTVSWFKVSGNYYWYLNRANENAAPDEIWVIPSNKITPIPDGQSYIRGYLFKDGNTTLTLEPWQVMHGHTFNPDNPFVGLSAIESLALDGNADIAQQAYTAKLFGKDNAKVPGALAFADFVEQSQWEKMQEETKEKWGGMNRSGPMWLRGVGAGGVQWLQMALNQKDMEFLAQRQFTKEEIYGKLAPGLAAVLDPNATEANALAGKAILAEYALWPMLVMMAEKIVNDVLPAYGNTLSGEFDDPRKSDRLLDLQEQAEYSKTHTIEEIRKEYYGDDPLGDDRDSLLPAEIKPAPSTPQQLNTDTTPAASTTASPVSVPVASSATVTDGQAASAEVQAEMKAWETFAIRRIGKESGRDFEPHAIPLLQAARIKARVGRATSAADVRQVFLAERVGEDTLRSVLEGVLYEMGNE